MTETFFFYDLETSGRSPRSARIMQFAGQRTSLDLKPIGEPVNILIALTADIVPEPEAILLTGITPQRTLQEGVSEASFCEKFITEIASPGTIFVGYNTVRFDDEFMRYLLYRNFYDPYEWQWKDGRSRWDLLDMVRMSRALRPGGIEWPVDSSTGNPTNRLELLTKANNLIHESAHDALSDVWASIELAKLLRQKQTKLFDYLLHMRDKKQVAQLATAGNPFVYTSGSYPSEYEKTTVVTALAAHPKKQGALVYDLRHNPEPFLAMKPDELAAAWKWKHDKEELQLPVKTLQFNRCPAVAPIVVLDSASEKRLSIDKSMLKKHHKILQDTPEFTNRIIEALSLHDTRRQAEYAAKDQIVDSQLYDGFISDHDKSIEVELLQSPKNKLRSFEGAFRDARLNKLVPLYRARNYPTTLSDEEQADWEEYRTKRLLGGGESSQLAQYFTLLARIDQSGNVTPEGRYILEELQLYGQSIMPVGFDGL